jgi:hypothetical protein
LPGAGRVATIAPVPGVDFLNAIVGELIEVAPVERHASVGCDVDGAHGPATRRIERAERLAYGEPDVRAAGEREAIFRRLYRGDASLSRRGPRVGSQH